MQSANLLPVAAAHQFQRKRITAAWSKSVVCGVLVTGALIYAAQVRVATQNRIIEQQRLAAKYPREIQTENQQLHRRLVGLQTHEAQQVRLRSQYSPIVIVAMLRDLKVQLKGALEVASLEFVDDSDRDSAGNEGTMHGYMALQLVTDDTTHSSAVMQKLRESNLFKKVTLSSALEKLNSHATDVRFSVRCEF